MCQVYLCLCCCVCLVRVCVFVGVLTDPSDTLALVFFIFISCLALPCGVLRSLGESSSASGGRYIRSGRLWRKKPPLCSNRWRLSWSEGKGRVPVPDERQCSQCTRTKTAKRGGGGGVNVLLARAAQCSTYTLRLSRSRYSGICVSTDSTGNAPPSPPTFSHYFSQDWPIGTCIMACRRCLVLQARLPLAQSGREATCPPHT